MNQLIESVGSVVGAVPGGRWTWGAVTLLAVPRVRRTILRPVARTVIRSGLAVSDGARGVVSGVREQTGELVAEVRAERNPAVA